MISSGTVALYGPFLFIFFFGGTQGYGFHPIKNLRNCDEEIVAPFNSNFHNKTLCESEVMWITRFVTYLSIVFHIYLHISQKSCDLKARIPQRQDGGTKQVKSVNIETFVYYNELEMNNNK